MATFTSAKKLNEIQEVELLPEDWYLVRIVKEPRTVPNNHKKAGKPVEDGGGMNWQISLRVQHEKPEWHGRPLMISLPLPSADVYSEDHDEPEEVGRIIEECMINTVSGRTIYDEKLERIGRWAAAFAGYDYNEMGDEVNLELSQGQEAMIYVGQGPSFRDPDKIVNEIDIFNSVPMKVV